MIDKKIKRGDKVIYEDEIFTVKSIEKSWTRDDLADVLHFDNGNSASRNLCKKVITEKPILYVDMDDVLCNFTKAHKEDRIKNPTQMYPQSQWGFFLKLEEMPDAINSFKILQEKYDVWILTRPSVYNVNCYTEKAEWVLEHLGFDVLEKTILCGKKSLLKGDYLIDDSDRDGQLEFEGEWIQFGSNKFPDWNTIVQYLMIDLI